MPKRQNKKNTRKRKPQNIFFSLFFILFLGLVFWTQESLSQTQLPEPGEPPKLYSNQTRDDLKQTFCAAIDSAQQSVMLIIYGLTDPDIIESLKRKSEQGIPVHVVCDAKASPYIDKKLGPGIHTVRRFGPGLMHQKLLVIDDHQNWIGSANMTTDSLRMHGNLVSAIDSVALARLIKTKGETLNEEGRETPLPHETFQVNDQELEMWFLPDCKGAVKRLRDLICSAKKTIKVAMYTWTRYDMAHAVIAAAKRGVQTEVVIDNSSGKGTSSKVVALLKKNGIPVSLSQGPGLLHHKFLYIDGNTLVNGSANWTKNAFSNNDDCFFVLHDLNAEQHDQMEDLWNIIRTESTIQ